MAITIPNARNAQLMATKSIRPFRRGGPNPSAITVTGDPTITTFEDGGVNYTQLRWDTSGSYTLSSDLDAEYALVGGGASGGSTSGGQGGNGGGGAGWYHQSAGRETLPAGAYTITIGAGGAPASGAAGNDGSDSTVTGPVSFTGQGGGGGGAAIDAANIVGRPGGNGGGGGGGTSDATWDGGVGDPGNDGGTGHGSSTSADRAGGGGGGAGGPGGNASAATIGMGGPGVTLTFTDTDLIVAAGGNGDLSTSPPGVIPGVGGGSHGAYDEPSIAGGDGVYIMVVRSDEAVIQ